MRWSIEELFFGIKIASNSGRPFLYKLTHCFNSFYRILRVIFRWVFTGYCQQSLYDLSTFFMLVIYQRLKMFKKLGIESSPVGLELEEWEQIIDRLIKGFDIMINGTLYAEGTKAITHFCLALTDDEKRTVRDSVNKQEAYDKETLQLFARYCGDLWN